MKAMLLKQLKYFISIVEKGNFTEAAEENYISQSAISQQIQSLENELGYKLLIREKRTFTLTPAGKYIYHQSKNIIENIEDMQEKAKFIANTKNYSIKIGYLKNYTGKKMQKAIVEFNKRFPEVEIEIVSGTHDELGNKVFNNEIDFYAVSFVMLTMLHMVDLKKSVSLEQKHWDMVEIVVISIFSKNSLYTLINKLHIDKLNK